jgi:hypothetical protein
MEQKPAGGFVNSPAEGTPGKEVLDPELESWPSSWTSTSHDQADLICKFNHS